MDIYDRIEHVREERGFSRRKLAEKAGIKPSTLQSLFDRRPEHFPSKYVTLIAEALGVSKDTLTGEKSNCIADAAVRAMIMRIIDEAMEKHDRYVTIKFFDGGPFVTVYPVTDDDETEG